ncbi:MAG: CoA activase, partial [Gemmatimonadales bacterium]|nr:CoA activase [Gemmatimonadales bacterium]NIN12546.1 CoA activase [Gemmatimonadales bacterium]NIN50917.1 CoA activase [Gemmatimonadales bacterium]NIP08381.1 CoA activase [Gemmatimonadales bacterium]NIR03546.1 CoA activase [Gemmatimonadales bacterium]
MITVGIDMGAKTIKVVVLRDGDIVGKAMTVAGFESREAAERAFTEALAEADVGKDEVGRVVATGAGRHHAPYAEADISEVGCDAKAAITLCPT